MLVFSEGVPRSGKSYDAVKNHILPALKKGRHVYARLNGLNHEKIAEHLKLPVERVRELLHQVPTSEVVETFKARQFFTEAQSAMASPGHEQGQWVIDPKFKNALIVIDEVHEFYVGGGRDALDPAIEQFFALHGHYGMDVLTMTQFYKRVHTALRFRIERKNTFQKLSALGKKGEGMYRETAWQTVSPDKYEKVGAKTCTYDPKIFPLYHGIVGGGDGGVEQAVYEGGRTSVWRGMALRAAIIIPLGLFAIWFLLDFFTGGGTALVDSSKVAIGTPKATSQPVPVQAGEVWQQAPVQSAAAQPAGPPVKEPTQLEKNMAAMAPQQRYVWELTGKGRIRYTGGAKVGEDTVGWVEWFDTAGLPLDRLSLAQLRAMDIAVELYDYGVHLVAKGEAIVVTAWPLNMPVREEQPRLYRLDDQGGALAGRVSEANPAASAPTALGIGEPGREARYGQFRNEPLGPDRYEATAW